MKLVGMLDSPYVRRVAISLDALDLAFEHESVSVFSTFERFREINPVVKAPTLICDDGGILMDSSLILQYIEAGRCGGHSPLWSSEGRHAPAAVPRGGLRVGGRGRRSCSWSMKRSCGRHRRSTNHGRPAYAGSSPLRLPHWRPCSPAKPRWRRRVPVTPPSGRRWCGSSRSR